MASFLGCDLGLDGYEVVLGGHHAGQLIAARGRDRQHQEVTVAVRDLVLCRSLQTAERLAPTG